MREIGSLTCIDYSTSFQTKYSWKFSAYNLHFLLLFYDLIVTSSTCMCDYVGFVREQMLSLATNRLKSALAWQVQEPDAHIKSSDHWPNHPLVVNELTICLSERNITKYWQNKILSPFYDVASKIVNERMRNVSLSNLREMQVLSTWEQIYNCSFIAHWFEFWMALDQHLILIIWFILPLKFRPHFKAI